MPELVPFFFALVLWYLNPVLGLLFLLASDAFGIGVDGDYLTGLAMFVLSIAMWFVRRARQDVDTEE